MSRILGVDYGERRIGLALSDPLGIIAKPLKVIDRKKTIDYLSAIIETAKERDVNKIVVGMPFTLKGELSKQTKIVTEFITELFNQGKIQIIPVDERLSSVSAKKSLREQGIKTGHEKGRVDETAAAIILQEYLDSQS